MQSLLNLEGWELFWTVAGFGIIGGGALVGLMTLVNWAALVGEEWRRQR